MAEQKTTSSPSKRYLWGNLLAMAAVVVVLLFLTFTWLDVYTHHGEVVEIPRVKGMTPEQAIPLFRQHKLKCAVVDSTYIKDMPAGVILEVSPAEGHAVKKGRMIYLTVNRSYIPTTPIPDVADNSSYRQARMKLISAGFKLDSVQYISGEKDWVYGVLYRGQKMEAGSQAPLGALLTLLVGDGGGEQQTDSLQVDTPLGEEPATVDESWF